MFQFVRAAGGATIQDFRLSRHEQQRRTREFPQHNAWGIAQNPPALYPDIGYPGPRGKRPDLQNGPKIRRWLERRYAAGCRPLGSPWYQYLKDKSLRGHTIARPLIGRLDHHEQNILRRLQGTAIVGGPIASVYYPHAVLMAWQAGPVAWPRGLKMPGQETPAQRAIRQRAPGQGQRGRPPGSQNGPRVPPAPHIRQGRLQRLRPRGGNNVRSKTPAGVSPSRADM